MLGRSDGPTSVRYTLLLFAALAVGYGTIIAAFGSGPAHGDEARYLDDALRLLGRPEADPPPNLWNGPGYPLVIAPLVWLSLPLVAVRELNALFLFGGLLAIFASLRYFLDDTRSLLATVVIGFYPPLLTEAVVAYTESLSFLLVAVSVLCCLRLARADRMNVLATVTTAAPFACLALTKVFFGYVLIASGMAAAAGAVATQRAAWRRFAAVMLVAVLCCTPWLWYTWRQTGRILYWGSPGPTSLYWISTPFAGEYGDWHHPAEFGLQPQLAAHHEAFFASIEHLDLMRRNDALTSRAVGNITAHPLKYAENVALNVGRMLFSYPYSYTAQKPTTFLYLLANMFIVAVFPVAAWITLRRWRCVADGMKMLLVFGAIAFAGSALVSAYPRQFTVLTPIVFVWMASAAAMLFGVQPGNLRR